MGLGIRWFRSLYMRTVLRDIADALVASGLPEESPGTGKRRPGAPYLASWVRAYRTRSWS